MTNGTDSNMNTDNSHLPFDLEQGTSILKRFAHMRILIVGDVMLDEYLTGDADRISPEAPVPVVLVQAEKHFVGGAGNVARNVCSLGGSATLVGIRGDDSPGEKLEQCLIADGIDASLVTLPHRPTTVKTRILARLQQVVRVDREDASPLALAAVTEVLDTVAKALPHCQAVVVSDYGKGIVNTVFMAELHTLIAAQARIIPVLVDPKPQNIHLYQNVTLLTPNAKETSEAVDMPAKTPEQILAAGRAIMAKLRCPHLVTTLGSLGMAVFVSPSEVWHIPTTARRVFDVTGAGDTVIATAALGIAAGATLTESCILANYAAGIVVGEVGAATATPQQIQAVLASSQHANIARWA